MTLRGALLIAASAAFVIALVLWGALRQPDNDCRTPVATTYSSGKNGAKALYLLMEQSDLSVTRRRGFQLNGDGDAEVVLWILSASPLPPADADALLGFVKDGGTVVAPPELLADLFVRSGIAGARAQKGIDVGAGAITNSKNACKTAPCALDNWRKLKLTAPPDELGRLTGVEPVQVYASLGGRPIVARYQLGDGNVVSAGALGSLRNGAIGDGDAGPFWVRVAASLGPTHAFDELHTGYGDLNLITLIWRAPYRWAVLDLGLVLALGVWGFGARARRAEIDPTPRRRETKDHVQAVADWWGRSGDLGLPLAALLLGLDARAAGRMHAADGHNFVAWARAVRPDLGARAADAWDRALRLLTPAARKPSSTRSSTRASTRSSTRSSTREVVTVAAELRAIEMEVFPC